MKPILPHPPSPESARPAFPGKNVFPARPKPLRDRRFSPAKRKDREFSRYDFVFQRKLASFAGF